jgi:phosphohistidine phosphatase
MPRLFLVRHAKADQLFAGPDRDRPLVPAGRTDAELIGRHMAEEGWRPERALCSPARRALDTLQAVLTRIHRRIDVAIEPELYDHMDTDYMDLLRHRGGEAVSLLVVGHSPAVRNTAVLLAARTPDVRLHQMQAHYPTAALTVLDFDRPWGELAAYCGRLASFVRPQDLAA